MITADGLLTAFAPATTAVRSIALVVHKVGSNSRQKEGSTFRSAHNADVREWADAGALLGVWARRYKVFAFDATYIWPGRIGENVRPTLGAVHGRDHDRLQSLGLAAARGVHDGAGRGSGVGHRSVLRGWLRGGSRRRPWELVVSPTGRPGRRRGL